MNEHDIVGLIFIICILILALATAEMIHPTIHNLVAKIKGKRND